MSAWLHAGVMDRSLLAAQLAGDSLGLSDPLQGAARWVLALYGLLVVVGLVADLVLLVRWPVLAGSVRNSVRRVVLRPWAWTDVLWIGVCLFLAHIFMLGVILSLHYWGVLEPMDEAAVALVTQSLSFHGLTLVVVLWRMIRGRLTWVDSFLVPDSTLGRGFRLGLLAYVACLPAVVFYGVTYQLWLQAQGFEVEPQDVVHLVLALKSPMIRVYVVFLVVILAPLAEEVLFRGILFPVLTRQWGMGVGVFLNALLFAAMHRHLPSFLPLFIFAVGLSLAYAFTGSLAVPVVMHMVFNGLTMVVMHLMSGAF